MNQRLFQSLVKLAADQRFGPMRQAVSSFLKSKGLPEDHPHVVLSGGAMYGHGLRDRYDDIDLYIPGLKGAVVESHNGINIDAKGTFTFGDQDRSREVLERAVSHPSGLHFQSPEDILTFKRFMNRPKDQRDIQVLEHYLEKHKTAAERLPEPEHQEFLDEHFGAAPRWQEFQRNLRSKSFVQAVKDDPRADKKLQRFSENIGRHKQSKGVPSFQVPSQSSGKHYTVKYHPDIDRYTCNCGDWNYARSWRRGQKTKDCKHVRMVQLELKAQGKDPSTFIKEAFDRLASLLL